MNRLVILGCSARKRTADGPLAALDLYDGPSFRTLRHYLAQSPGDVETAVVSAEHGLVSGSTPINWYDRPLTAERTDALRQQIDGQWSALLRHGFQSIFISLGRRYEPIVRGHIASLPASVRVDHASGGPGVRASALYKWLHGSAPQISRGRNTSTPVTVAGIALNMTTEVLLDEAKRRLHSEKPAALAFHTWYVDLDGLPISVKWLVSIATSLPVSRFSTHTAVRALRRIGITVHAR